jgi:hypothetical protein
VTRQELCSYPRILAGDRIRTAERLDRTQGDVAKIADGRGDDGQEPPALP